MNVTDIAIAKGDIKDYEHFSVTRVTLFVGTVRANAYFQFIFMKDTEIHHIDLPSLVFKPDQVTQNVTVRGQNFIPIRGELWCKLYFTDEPYEVLGNFINNHTIECEVP